jgi:DeoR family glycerol-3-phosphate regulon repressor
MAQQIRHEDIIKLITEQGFVSIDELVALFGVTPQTIRRDLNLLAQDNRIRRYHGGAAIESSTVNTEYSKRKAQQLDQKKRIAKAVAALIPDNASIFINIGTTNEAIARELLQRNGLKVITNNLNVASILSSKEDFQITITGGQVRSRDGGIIGEATIDFIKQFRVDFGIIGISGIEEDGSLMDFDYQEVRVAQAIIEHSRLVILAADSSKFGRRTVNYLGDLSLIDTLVTDQAPPKKISQLMKQYKRKLIVAS